MKLLLGFFLLGLSWLQPMHLFPWLSWHSEVLAYAVVLAMGWELVYLATRRRSSGVFAIPVAAWPLMGLAAIFFLQWCAGQIIFGGDVVVYIAYVWLCLASLIVGFTGERERFSPTLVLAGALVAGAMCSAIIALAQVFEVWDSYGWIHHAPYTRRPGANLGQPNQLATLLLMGMVSVLYLFESRKLGRTLSVVMLGVLLLGMAITESRSGMLSFVVLNVWWFAKRKFVTLRTHAWFMPFMGLAFMVLFLAWPVVYAEVFQNQVGFSAFNHPAAFNRWMVWPQLLQAVWLRPWLGWGFGQVATAHNAVVDAYAKSEQYTYAHNIVLDFVLGIGLPLTLLLVLMTGVWLWRRMRATQHLGPWYCLAVVVPVAVHSFVEFPFAYSYFLVPVMFAIGALEGQLGSIPGFQLGLKPVAAGLFIMTAAVVWSVPEYIAIDEDFRIVRLETLRVGKAPDGYQRPTVRIFTQLDALLHGARVVPRPNMPEHEIELARTVALHFPMIATQNKYALSLALNGNPVEAVRQLRVMRAQQDTKTYVKIKQVWATMAAEQYPQLHELQMP